MLNFHQLCDRRIELARTCTGRDLLAEATAAYPGNSRQHHFDLQMPFALALSNEVLDEKYDAVVVDEAQDFSDEYWFAGGELLRDLAESYLYIFIDENQTLYRRHANLPVNDEPLFLERLFVLDASLFAEVESMDSFANFSGRVFRSTRKDIIEALCDLHLAVLLRVGKRPQK